MRWAKKRHDEDDGEKKISFRFLLAKRITRSELFALSLVLLMYITVVGMMGSWETEKYKRQFGYLDGSNLIFGKKNIEMQQKVFNTLSNFYFVIFKDSNLSNKTISSNYFYSFLNR